jgi:hypothetical protein
LHLAPGGYLWADLVISYTFPRPDIGSVPNKNDPGLVGDLANVSSPCRTLQFKDMLDMPAQIGKAIHVAKPRQAPELLGSRHHASLRHTPPWYKHFAGLRAATQADLVAWPCLLAPFFALGWAHMPCYCYIITCLIGSVWRPPPARRGNTGAAEDCVVDTASAHD